jgi:phosphate transport system ATP-binding protein
MMMEHAFAIKTTVMASTQIGESAETIDNAVKMSAKNLSVYYRAFRAVTDVTLPIYSNQITAIIGPSGCGKSTLLRTFNRMNDLVAGSRIEGMVTLDEH